MFSCPDTSPHRRTQDPLFNPTVRRIPRSALSPRGATMAFASTVTRKNKGAANNRYQGLHMKNGKWRASVVLDKAFKSAEEAAEYRRRTISRMRAQPAISPMKHTRQQTCSSIRRKKTPNQQLVSTSSPGRLRLRTSATRSTGKYLAPLEGHSADDEMGPVFEEDNVKIGDWHNGLELTLDTLKYKRKKYLGKKPPNRLERSWVRPKRLTLRKIERPQTVEFGQARYMSPRSYINRVSRKEAFIQQHGTFHPKYVALTQNPALSNILVKQEEKARRQAEAAHARAPHEDYRDKLTFEMRESVGDIYATMLTRTARRRNPMLAQE